MATVKRKSTKFNGQAAGKPNLAMAYGAVASDLMQRLGDAQAAQMGPPTSTEDKVAPATNEDRVKAWNTRNPEATDEAMQALADQKFAEHTQAGMDRETAIRATSEDLTHYRYNQRLKIYTYGQIGFNEQVEAAKRMAKLAARESTPSPLPPPPTMPSAALTSAAMVPAETPGIVREFPAGPAALPELPQTPTSLPQTPSNLPTTASPLVTPEIPPGGPL